MREEFSILANNLKTFKKEADIETQRVRTWIKVYCPELHVLVPTISTETCHSLYSNFRELSAGNTKTQKVRIFKELVEKTCQPQFRFLETWKNEYEELPKEGLNNICLRRAVQTGYPERWALYYRANIEQYPRFLSIALRGNELPLTLNEGMMSAITERLTEDVDLFTDKQIFYLARTSFYSEQWTKLLNPLLSEERISLLSDLCLQDKNIDRFLNPTMPISRLIDEIYSYYGTARSDDSRLPSSRVSFSPATMQRNKKESYDFHYGNQKGADVDWEHLKYGVAGYPL